MAEEEKPTGWYGVDLDSSLAHYTEWKGESHIGEPLPKMVERIKQWRKEGKEVRIFTARVANNGTAEDILKAQRATVFIMEYCKKHLGEILPITCMKDQHMLEIWDDRAVQLVPNTGEPLQEPAYAKW